ncbi:MAG: ABC transporter substrate-binding protein [Hyphomicrobiales bacterium]
MMRAGKLMGLAVLGALVASPQAKAQTKLDGSEVKIGVIYTVDGVWGTYGVEGFRGVDYAADDLNAKGGVGGVKVKLVKYDNHGNASELPNIVRQLATVDNVLAIIGPNTSGEAEIVFPIANQLKVPVLGTSVAKGGLLDKNRPWAFRNVMPDDLNTAPVIAKVVKDKDIKTVAVVMDVKDAVSKYMGTAFWPPLLDKLGIKELTRSDPVTFQSGDPSVTAQVTKLKALNPDAVAVVGSPGDAAKVAIEIRRQGMTQQLLGSGALYGDEFLRSGGKAVEGAITSAQFWRDDPTPQVRALVESFEKRSGHMAALHEAFAYDAVLTIAKAIETGGATNKAGDLEKDRAKIRDALDGIKILGISGSYAIDAKTGEVIRPFMEATIKNGQWSVELLK